MSVLDTSVTSEILHFSHYVLCNWCRYALRSCDLLCLLVNQTRRNGEPKHGWNVNDDVSLPVPKCEVETWSTVATPHQPQQVNFWVHICIPQIVLSVVHYTWETYCESIGKGQGFARSSFGFPKLPFSCCSVPTCRCPLMRVISVTRLYIFTSLVIKLQISSMWPGTSTVTKSQNKALRQILYKMKHFWDKYLVLGFFFELDNGTYK